MLDVEDIWDDEQYNEYERMRFSPGYTVHGENGYSCTHYPPGQRPLQDAPVEVFYQAGFDVPFLENLPPQRAHIPAVTYHHDYVVKELQAEVERADARTRNASLLARAALDANASLHDKVSETRVDALVDAAAVCQSYVHETVSADAQYVLGCVREVLLKMANEDA